MRDRVKATPSTGIASIRVKSKMERGDSDSYTWKPVHTPFEPIETYYYVGLENFKAVDKEGKESDFFSVKALMKQLGYK